MLRNKSYVQQLRPVLHGLAVGSACALFTLLYLSTVASADALPKEAITPFIQQDLAPDDASGLSVFSNQQASSSLLFLGTQHTFDESNPQIADIERLFTKFNPSVVLTEGGEWKIEATRREAIRVGGEMGFVSFIAAKRNIPRKSLEPAFEDEIVAMLAMHKAVDVKLFYALRMISQFKRQQSAKSLVDRMNELLDANHRSGLPKLPDSPRNADELTQLLQSRFPELQDWKKLDPWSDGRYPPESDGVPLMSRIAKASATYRERQMLVTIKSHLKSGSRVLVVAGTSHLATLMPALQ
jgi:hypothetical protein